MQFACIQDCSVCPFGCGRCFSASAGKTVVNNPIPQIIQESEPVEVENRVEEPEEIEVVTVPERNNSIEEYSEEANNAIQENLNLPVLAEVQYELKDVTPKKGILNLLKKR